MNPVIPKQRAAMLVAALAGAVLAGPVIADSQHSNPDECAANPDAGNCPSSYQHLDWVPYQNLPAERQIQRAKHCGGGFLDPLRHLDT